MNIICCKFPLLVLTHFHLQLPFTKKPPSLRFRLQGFGSLFVGISSELFGLLVFMLAEMVMISSSITAWISDLLACMGGCFGCCTKPRPIIAVDEVAKGLRIQGQTVRKPTISDGFWSSSTCDLDNCIIQSQRSVASVTTLNQILYHSSGTSSESTDPYFVNQGLLLWNESRLRWIGSDRPRNQSQQRREPRLNWSATYESLLGTRRPFSKPIPLSEMIEFLVDVWEQEGMYD